MRVANNVEITRLELRMLYQIQKDTAFKVIRPTGLSFMKCDIANAPVIHMNIQQAGIETNWIDWDEWEDAEKEEIEFDHDTVYSVLQLEDGMGTVHTLMALLYEGKMYVYLLSGYCLAGWKAVNVKEHQNGLPDTLWEEDGATFLPQYDMKRED